MAISSCPHCRKPIAPNAMNCRWCKAVFETPEEREAKRAAAADAEAAELSAWPGSQAPLPSPLSMRSWIAIPLLGVLGLGLAVATARTGTNLEASLKIAGVMLLVTGLLTLSLVWRDLRTMGARRLRTPRETAVFYFGMIALRDFARAHLVLAGYETAMNRHIDLAGVWRALASSSGETQTKVIATIGGQKRITDDAVLVDVTIAFARTTSTHVPMVGTYRQTETRGLIVSKLVVRRGARWYVVNGLPSEKIDLDMADRIAPPNPGA